MKHRLPFFLVAIVLVPVCLNGQGRLSGLSYFDYYYNVSRPATIGSLSNSASAGAKDMEAFQIRRLFLTYDNDLSKEFAARVRLDADQSATTTDGRISFYLKDASLTWTDIFPRSSMVIGLQPTLPIELIEQVWGYRSVEKIIMDLRGIVPPRDMGVSLRGSIDEEGIFGYGLFIGNNSSARPASSKYKRYYGQVVVRPAQGFVLAAYGDYNDRASIADPYNAGVFVANGILTADGMAGYTEPGKFSAGIEVFNATTLHGHNDGVLLSNLQSLGASVFGSVNVERSVALLARFDFFDPNINSDVRGDSRNYVIAGISWKPNPNVSIIPNILYETYEQLPTGTTPTASVTARITCFYVFL
jgi:hypothetical protein